MKKILRKVLPRKILNLFWHLPVAIFANVKYGFPSRKLVVVGVTGTDGKTTTVNMIYRILQNSGKKASIVSTINAEIAGKSIDTGFHVTSPDPLKLQKLLKESVDNGDEIAVLEVTSHALDQYRFWGVRFDTAVITNITHEHLDYHRTFESYLNTKAKLIKDVRSTVLNRDERHFAQLSKMTRREVVSFGLSSDATLNPGNFSLKLKLPGKFNLLNAFAAALVCRGLGVDDETIKQSLESFVQLRGRMDRVENKQGVHIFIDFAHTPNGLQNALSSLSEEYIKEKSGNHPRLISVFGCAGLRDRDKRPMMGKISAKTADVTIITAEDPRGMVDEISSQILEGAKQGGGILGKNLFVENDRTRAIALALNIAKRGDVVGIFGKGHERSMNLDGAVETEWSDYDAVKKALEGRWKKS